MDKLEKLINNYLRQSHMMQVATVSGRKPWVATVYYVVDDELNLYWASPEKTNHSQHIRKNSNVAVAVPVVHKKNKPVVGLQAEGQANIIENIKLCEKIAEKYASEFGFGDKWIEKVCDGQTVHKLYKFKPTKFVLFDDINFPNDPKKEWIL